MMSLAEAEQPHPADDTSESQHLRNDRHPQCWTMSPRRHLTHVESPDPSPTQTAHSVHNQTHRQKKSHILHSHLFLHKVKKLIPYRLIKVNVLNIILSRYSFIHSGYF